MKRKIKPLSFEPKYHRRVSQGKYLRLPLKPTKGFTIGELDLERPSHPIEQTDKGNVASVIANTNTAFKLGLSSGEVL